MTRAASSVPSRDRSLLVVSHPAVLPVNQEIYRDLQSLGWAVELVVPARWRHEYREDAFAAEPLEELRSRFHPLPVLGAGRPQRHVYRCRTRALIKRTGPSIVLLEQESFSAAALQWGLAASALGVPFGVQQDENLDRHFPAAVRGARLAILRRADFVLARSPTAAALARQWGARRRVAVVPHSVPLWRVPNPRKSAGEFVVGYAGRLVAEKGVTDLVEAARCLPGPVRLLLVGDGPLRSSLAADTHAGLQVEVRTGVDHGDMAAAYAEMDVLVLPSRTTERWVEQFGRVLVEALSCGVPVVGSSSGEIPWVIEVTKGGWVFPEGDVTALGQLLEHIRAHPHEAGRRAADGRRNALAMFACAAVAKQTHQLLLDVLGGEP